MTEPVIVKLQDVLDAGHCVTHTKAWFAQYGIPFMPFVRNGVSSEVLLATGDAYAKKVVDVAIKRVEAENG